MCGIIFIVKIEVYHNIFKVFFRTLYHVSVLQFPRGRRDRIVVIRNEKKLLVMEVVHRAQGHNVPMSSL